MGYGFKSSMGPKIPVVNSTGVTTENRFSLDAIQNNASIDGTLANKISVISNNLVTWALIPESYKEVISYFVSTVFPSLAVSTTSTISGIFTKGIYITYSGMKVTSSYGSFILHGYGMMSVHVMISNGSSSGVMMDMY